MAHDTQCHITRPGISASRGPWCHFRTAGTQAAAFADNAPSLRVMEKVGLRHEGTFRGESLHLTRGWVDGVTYAMLASEFLARV